MALTPDTNQSFYREVDDELRRDQLGSFWTRYGKMLLASLALLAIAGAAYAYWRSEETKKAAAQSETLDKVITDLGEGREAGVAPQLATLAASDNEGYRATALLTQADLALGKGDAKAAAAIFGRVAADAALPQPYRDLALVRQTAAEFDTLAPATVIARLAPLAKAGNPFFGSAGEMVGAAYLKQNNPKAAAPIFAAVAKDEGVPETIRSRAVQMAGTLGVDAIPEPKNAPNAGTAGRSR